MHDRVLYLRGAAFLVVSRVTPLHFYK